MPCGILRGCGSAGEDDALSRSASLAEGGTSVTPVKDSMINAGTSDGEGE